MTLEQAIQRIQNKESLITQLKKEVRDTKMLLRDLAPFKIGQKVKVTQENYRGSATITVCYISDVIYQSYLKEKIQYKFNKVKKDGTVSEQSAGIHSYASIEAF